MPSPLFIAWHRTKKTSHPAVRNQRSLMAARGFSCRPRVLDLLAAIRFRMLDPFRYWTSFVSVLTVDLRENEHLQKAHFFIIYFYFIHPFISGGEDTGSHNSKSPSSQSASACPLKIKLASLRTRSGPHPIRSSPRFYFR